MKINPYKPHDDDSIEREQATNWLLPYANMMCLMCGFFVVLYTLNSGNSGLPTSLALGAINRTPDAVNKQVAAVNPEILNAQGEIQAQNEQQKKLIEQLAKQAEELQIQLAEQKKAVEERAKSSDQLIFEKRAIEDQLAVLKLEKADLEKKVTDAALDRIQLVDQIKSAQEQNTAQQKLRDQKEKEIKQKELQLRGKDKQINESNQDFEYTKNIIETQEAQIAQLRSQLRDAQGEISSLPQHLMFILKWASAQDLDLSIVDPNGKIFDLKRRNYSGYKGQFTADAKLGPGSEVWQTQQLVPGEYKLLVTFNPGPVGSKQTANFVIQANSARDSKETLSYSLDASKRTKELRIKVSSKGLIEFK